DANQVRQQVGATPAGDDPEEHHGQGDAGPGAVNRAVIRVEGDLQPTAQREPVDEDERRNPERPQLSEGIVAQLSHLSGDVLARDVADFAEVSTGGEEVGLAGDGDCSDLTL